MIQFYAMKIRKEQFCDWRVKISWFAFQDVETKCISMNARILVSLARCSATGKHPLRYIHDCNRGPWPPSSCPLAGAARVRRESCAAQMRKLHAEPECACANVAAPTARGRKLHACKYLQDTLSAVLTVVLNDTGDSSLHVMSVFTSLRHAM